MAAAMDESMFTGDIINGFKIYRYAKDKDWCAYRGGDDWVYMREFLSEKGYERLIKRVLKAKKASHRGK